MAKASRVAARTAKNMGSFGGLLKEVNTKLDLLISLAGGGKVGKKNPKLVETPASIAEAEVEAESAARAEAEAEAATKAESDKAAAVKAAEAKQAADAAALAKANKAATKALSPKKK